jgi:carbon storage regulator
MLVLTRKQMQGLCINGNIMVTVLKVRGNQVRLGLEVPQGLPVRRQPAPERLPRPAEEEAFAQAVVEV